MKPLLTALAFALAGCASTPTAKEAAAEKKLHEAGEAGAEDLRRSGVDESGTGTTNPPKSDFYIDL